MKTDLMAIFVLLVADSTTVPAVLATVVAFFAAIYNYIPRRRMYNHSKTRCGPLAFHCAAVVTALGAVQASAGSQSATQQQPLGAKVSLSNASPVGYVCCARAILCSAAPILPNHAALPSAAQQHKSNMCLRAFLN